MKHLIIFLLSTVLVVSGSQSSTAQLLDEIPQQGTASSVASDNASQNTDSEELFNEMFSDHDISEREPDRIENFDSAVENTANTLKKTNAINKATQARPAPEPIKGELKIGVIPGSFRVFQSYSGKTQCSFDVLLKSEINRESANLIIYLSSHSPEVIRTMPPSELFKVTNNNGNLTIETNCYPSY